MTLYSVHVPVAVGTVLLRVLDLIHRRVRA